MNTNIITVGDEKAIMSPELFNATNEIFANLTSDDVVSMGNLN